MENKDTLTKNKNDIATRIKNAIFYGAGSAIISRALTLLTTIIVSRMLGAYFYGQYTYLISTIALILAVAATGFGATISRVISLSIYPVNKISILVNWIKTITYIFTIMISILTYVFSKALSLQLVNDSSLTIGFKILAITIIFAVISALNSNVLLGFEKYKFIAFSELFYCLGYIIFSFCLTYYLGLTGAIVALLLSYILKSIFICYYSFKLMKFKIVINKNIKEFKKIIFTFTMPAIISSLFVIPVNWFNNTKLVTESGFESMSVISIAIQWVTILTYLAVQMGSLKPIYTSLYGEKRINELRMLFNKTTLYLTGVILLLVAILIPFTGKLLNLYGPTYYEYETIFYIFYIAIIIITVQSQVGNLLQAIGKMWVGLFLNLIWALIFIITFQFLSIYEAKGYAIAYLCSYSVHTVISLILVKFYWRNLK